MRNDMEEKDMDYRTYLKNYPDKDGRFMAALI